ncbi:hypothetical protein [Streptosporangium subroseum]|nr:hypothetical protein [Streptosporangium subroseum]
MQELIEERVVEDFDYLLINMRELCGPRILAILERRASLMAKALNRALLSDGQG